METQKKEMTALENTVNEAVKKRVEQELKAIQDVSALTLTVAKERIHELSMLYLEDNSSEEEEEMPRLEEIETSEEESKFLRGDEDWKQEARLTPRS